MQGLQGTFLVLYRMSHMDITNCCGRQPSWPRKHTHTRSPNFILEQEKILPKWYPLCPDFSRLNKTVCPFPHLIPIHTLLPAVKAFRPTFCKELRDGFSGIFCPLVFFLRKLFVGSLQTLCGIRTQSTKSHTQTSMHMLLALSILNLGK